MPESYLLSPKTDQWTLGNQVVALLWYLKHYSGLHCCQHSVVQRLREGLTEESLLREAPVVLDRDCLSQHRFGRLHSWLILEDIVNSIMAVDDLWAA